MKIPRKIRLGTRVGGGSFVIEEGEEPVHAFVGGMTGYGKSRLLNAFIRACIDQGEGVAVIEPGDLCEDVASYYGKKVNETGNKDVLKRIHYLRASPKRCFRYDLFRMPKFESFHPELVESVRRGWAHCKVQSVAEVLQSKQGTEGFEGMPRLQRVLQDVLTCVSVEVGGKRLSVADAKVLLDLTHPLHAPVFEKIRPKLPREVLADFDVMHSFRRVEDMRRESESTLNRLRSFLGPLTSQILSATGAEPSVNVYDIIQKGHCLLVPLQEDPFFSHDQKLSLGALILHDIIETLILTPREKRKNFTVVIDEAGEFLTVAGERLTRSLGMLRKHLGRLVIAGQNLDTFRRKS